MLNFYCLSIDDLVQIFGKGDWTLVDLLILTCIINAEENLYVDNFLLVLLGQKHIKIDVWRLDVLEFFETFFYYLNY